MKHILFLSYDGMTDPLGQSQVIPYLAALTKHGYEFTILSCDKPDKYEKQKEYVNKLIEPYPIKWVSIPYHKSPPILSSAYDYYKMRSKAMLLHKQKTFDMVHTRVGVPTLVALYLIKKTGIKFLNDIRGFWADERVDGGMWNLKNPLYKIIYKFFKNHEFECLKKADYNITLTYAGRDEVHSWKNIPNQPVPIEVIPCSADLDLFNPEKIDTHLQLQLRKELNIKENDFVVSYLGSIGGWYLTNEMLQFCKALQTKKPETKFLFISPHRHEEILAAAENNGIKKESIIIKSGMRHEVPVLLSLSNYSLFFIKPCYSKKSSSPTKHGEIMAMGIPVITNAGVGDVDMIVKKYNAGIIIENFIEQEYNQAVDEIIAENKFDAVAIRNGAKDFYALNTAVQRYLKVYKQILG